MVFEGEKTGVTIVRREGQPDMQVTLALTPLHPGERKYCITGEGVNAWCRTLALPPLMELAEARCNFIAAKQQYHLSGSSLDGAYLIYDNEEAHVFYTHRNDDNGGRERVGMGTLIARYLRLADKLSVTLEVSLKQYAAYVLRELFDPETGVVFNDIKRSTDYCRFYNYPWFARFFMELYGLWKDTAYLRYAYKAMNAFYERGGHIFYAIGVPMTELLPLLESANLAAEMETLKGQFMRHADIILKNGVNYPAHEVKYEQSIVAPPADILFQAYTLFHDGKYLDGAKQQLAVLSLFNGRQPDSCLYETAIRHWDGYWFGKRRLYGDTFPHYWSALTGRVYSLYSKVGGGEAARKVAEASIRGALGLFMSDGSAACARLYPLKVNGEWASCLDPWANDQDWALFFALDFFVDGE